MDVHVELLLGTRVRDVDGNVVGRIEEFRVDRDDARLQSYLIGASAPSEHCQQMLIVQNSVTGWRSLIAGMVLCLASSAHSVTTHFNSSEFIGFLLRRSPRISLRTAHWRRQVFGAKGY